MKKIVTTGLLMFAVMLVSPAQKKQNVLVTIGKERITLDDFLRIYERNNSNIQDPENKKTAEEYLQLYINFKLKVFEARHAGMDTTIAFKTELAGYRSELAAPYLTDTSFNEKLVEETYERMKKEINASHIMLAFSEEPTPADTLALYNKISDIRRKITEGMDFYEAALQFSQDPSAKYNKGDLGWFTVFQMIFPFESAAYATPPGQISQPVRTQFGYHLLRVNEIRDAEGEIHVAHIMKMYPENTSPEQKEKARLTADSIYTLILNGEDFNSLVRDYSDDKQSAGSNGEMAWFSKSRMVPAFAEAAFALENDGDISKPVDSGFGYHIIKRLEMRPLPAYNEVKQELEERLRQDAERSVPSKEVFINKLKNEYNFTKNQEAVDEILRKSSRLLQEEKPEFPGEQDNKTVLFSFGDKTYTVKNWIDRLQKLPKAQLTSDPLKLAGLFHSWENETLMTYEDSRLEEKYPEFRSLMQEYHDGILLFNISEKKVWQQASSDSVGLAQFYETNKQNYLWPERFKGVIIRCVNAPTKEVIEKYVDSGIPVNELYDLLNLPKASFKATEGIWAEKDNLITDYYIWSGPKPTDWNDDSDFVTGEIIPSEPKLLSETRGYHIADYQQYLEDIWIKGLRKKYPVKVNKKLLKQLGNE